MPINPAETNQPSKLADTQRQVNEADNQARLEEIKNYIEVNKGRIPSPEELSKVCEGATTQERIRLNVGLLQAAMVGAGIENNSIANSSHIENPEFVPYLGANRPRPEDNRPQLFYRQIKEEVKTGLFKREERYTDQVVVTARLNNVSNGEANVVLWLGRQEDGILQQNTSLTVLLTEKEYQTIVGSRYDDLSKKDKILRDMMEGRLTRAQVEERYQSSFKKSLHQENMERDARVKNTPQRLRTVETIQDHFDRIEGRYSELLQNVTSKMDQVVEETERKRREAARLAQEQQEEEARRAAEAQHPQPDVRRDSAEVNPDSDSAKMARELLELFIRKERSGLFDRMPGVDKAKLHGLAEYFRIVANSQEDGSRAVLRMLEPHIRQMLVDGESLPENFGDKLEDLLGVKLFESKGRGK